MVIVNLTSGIGNQLFQIAFGLYIEKTFRCEVRYNLTKNVSSQLNLNDIFNDKLIWATENDLKSKLGVFLKNQYIRYKLISFMRLFRINNLFNIQLEENFFLKKKFNQNYFFEGYWHNFNYFIEIEKRLRGLIVYKNKIDLDKSLALLGKSYKETVCVHIRRGDYLLKSNRKIYFQINRSYYIKAMNKLRLKLINPVFIIFSDDYDYIKSTYQRDKDVIFANDLSKDTQNDFQFMSQCNNFILSNSTFALWACYFNNSRRLVIRPPKWFNSDDYYRNIGYDYFPTNWNYINL